MMPEVRIITATYLRSKYEMQKADDKDWFSSGIRTEDGELSIVCETCRREGVVKRCWRLPKLLMGLKRKQLL